MCLGSATHSSVNFCPILKKTRSQNLSWGFVWQMTQKLVSLRFSAQRYMILNLCIFFGTPGTAELKTLYFIIICSAEDVFILNSNKFRMVYKVDGNPQLDFCDWSTYSNILKSEVKRVQTVWNPVVQIGWKLKKLS